jgi:hypothetical protein
MAKIVPDNIDFCNELEIYRRGDCPTSREYSLHNILWDPWRFLWVYDSCFCVGKVNPPKSGTATIWSSACQILFSVDTKNAQTLFFICNFGKPKL